MSNVAANGTKITIKADKTFPNGFLFTQSADDADMIDIPAIAIGGAAKGPNGNMVKWSKSETIKATLNVVADNLGDAKNFQTLLNANRSSQARTSVNDNITMIVAYPGQAPFTLTDGILTSGVALPSVNNEGKKKTFVFTFEFDDVTGGD